MAVSISKLSLERFTAFKKLDIDFSPGINVLIGKNGSGKTHILKAVYAACDVAGGSEDFAEKLANVFLPMDRNLGRLVHRQRGRARGSVTVFRRKKSIRAAFSTIKGSVRDAIVNGTIDWRKETLECAYIPVKEMLANAPRFLSLYASRDVHFEEVYADILHRAYRPRLRGPTDAKRGKLLDILGEHVEGRIVIRDDTFFREGPDGNLEFTLLAEGLRKLGLLWLLIQNGTLLEGAVLFWDEPEMNLNPSLFGVVVDVFLEMHRNGVQVFLATHDYVLLKEFDLRSRKQDKVMFHALYRSEPSGAVCVSSTDDYLAVHPNAIADTFADLYDRDVQRALGQGSRK